MDTELDHLETGAPYEGDYSAALDALQERLAHIQVRHIVHGQSTILLFEGWDAAGKGGIIRRLSAKFDPRHFSVHPIGAPTREEAERHFLWRFWTRLPGEGDIGIFDRSWYGRVLVERVEGYASEGEWKRAFDEINEFEASQVDNGTHLVKIFLHVTQEEQDRRLAARLDTPWKRWKVTAEDFRNRSKRDAYQQAIDDMLEATDTRWAPWATFDANDKKAARIAVLTHIADTLDRAVPQGFPDSDPMLVDMARKAFGYDTGRGGENGSGGEGL